MLKTTVLIGLLIGTSAAYAEEQIRFAPKAFFSSLVTKRLRYRAQRPAKLSTTRITPR
jgi:hypothetical protein